METEEHDEMEIQELYLERRTLEALDSIAGALHRIAVALELKK